MANISCDRCGNVLTRGARFCTKCGATSAAAETVDFNSLKTRPFDEQQDERQIAPPTSSHSAATEALSSSQKTEYISPIDAPHTASSDYDTDEIQRTRITSPAEQRTTSAPPDITVAYSETAPPAVNQPPRGRIGLLLAATLGVIVLGTAGSFLFINSRGASEAQPTNQTANDVKPAVTAQPSATPSIQPTVAVANNTPQTQPQATAEVVKTPLAKNADAAPKSSQPAVEKPALAQGKNVTDGTGAAVHNLNQGVTLMNGGRYQDALREFEYVRRLDPGNKSVYYLIGQTYHKQGQLQQALDAYRKCTSGIYSSVALNNVKSLEKRLGKTN